MQTIQLNLAHYNLFCPVTGEQILGPEYYEPSPALVAMWHSDTVEEADFYHPELERSWAEYSKKAEDEEDFVDVDEFLEMITIPNIICFAITNSGIACGPVSSTAWYCIDMDYQSEADDEATPADS